MLTEPTCLTSLGVPEWIDCWAFPPCLWYGKEGACSQREMKLRQKKIQWDVISCHNNSGFGFNSSMYPSYMWWTFKCGSLRIHKCSLRGNFFFEMLYSCIVGGLSAMYRSCSYVWPQCCLNRDSMCIFHIGTFTLTTGFYSILVCENGSWTQIGYVHFPLFR